MLKKFVIVSAVFFSSLLQAEIIEIRQIEDVRPEAIENALQFLSIDVEPGAIKNALYLFDIDDTLIVNPFSLGSSSWRNWAKQKIPKYDTPFVVYDALTLYIAKNASYIAVEPTTASLIADLQNEGIAALAFTARGRSQWYTSDIEGIDRFTHEQLIQAGMDFKKTIIPQELLSLEPTYFKDGIIFAQHIKKGDLLKHLFKDLNYLPSIIIFIDDKLEQVESVEKVVKETGIPFLGFWYRRAELDGANFDPLVADIQLEALLLRQEIVKDEDAKEIAQEKSGVDPQLYFKAILDSIDMAQLLPIIPEISTR